MPRPCLSGSKLRSGAFCWCIVCFCTTNGTFRILKKTREKKLSFWEIAEINLFRKIVYLSEPIYFIHFNLRHPVQHEIKNIWLDLVQSDSMIKCTIILRIILIYHIATIYLPTFCIMIMAIITHYIHWCESCTTLFQSHSVGKYPQ